MKRYIVASIQEDFEHYTSKGRWSNSQLDTLMKGLKAGVDVSIFADPKKYNAGWMDVLESGLEQGKDLRN